jgi:hypothetical protein
LTLAIAGCGADSGPPSATLGFRAGAGLFDDEEFLETEEWLGHPIAYTVQYTGRRSQRDMNGSAFGLLAGESATLPEFAHRLKLSITVPLGFGTANAGDREGREQIRANLVEVAEGKYDEAYRRVATRLIEAGYGDAVIRLGYEFNGAWAPWSSRTNEDEFIAAWRHVHEVLRAEGPDFQFEWTAIRPAWFEWGAAAYPGDEYVDIIGMDVYWRIHDGGFLWDAGTWERQYMRVLRDHFSFATAHGKPVSYPEWGLDGGDVPQFIEAMYEWLDGLPTQGPGRLLYHSYFDGREQFDLDQYPRARATYQRLFGDD